MTTLNSLQPQALVTYLHSIYNHYQLAKYMSEALQPTKSPWTREGVGSTKTPTCAIVLRVVNKWWGVCPSSYKLPAFP